VKNLKNFTAAEEENVKKNNEAGRDEAVFLLHSW
jgi:hypothetical protein